MLATGVAGARVASVPRSILDYCYFFDEGASKTLNGARRREGARTRSRPRKALG